MIKHWSNRFLTWFCQPDYLPDIQGDLEELYQENIETGSRVRAQWTYLADVIRLLRPSLIRHFFKNSIIYTGMIRNYFMVSIRNLVNHKVYAFINIFGLALGLAAFLMINQYIRFEKNYDQFFSHSEYLYRLTTDQVKEGVLGVRDAMSFNPSGKALLEELPEVVDYTTTYKFPEIVFRHNEAVRYEKMVVAADSNYFRLFDYDMVQGDPVTALNEPYSLILTESKARSYFGDSNPVGQHIEILSGLDRPFEVTGVIRDVPENTHYKFDILMSISSIRERLERDAWGGFNYYTYLRLDPRADLSAIRPRLPELSRKYIGEETTLVFNLQPVESIHLHSNFTYEPEIHGSADAVRFLVIISVFILLIAWVNYINLSTARAVDRAKEVGLRKVIGAHKGNLIGQFLLESLMINLMGALIAIGIVELALPFFNGLMEKEIARHVWNDPVFLRNVAIFFLAGTLITGFYPAIVLSGFKPVTVLKGKFRNSTSGTVLRKSLVVIQFTVSVILIAGTLIVGRQVSFMQSRDPGFDIDRTIGFRNPRVSDDQREALEERMKAFYRELRRNASITHVSGISNLPGGGSSDISSSAGGVKIVGLTDRLDATTYIMAYDENTISTLNMDLLAGRNFMEDLASDTAAVIVNQSFLDRFGIRDYESMITEKIQFGRDPENEKYHIIGVLADFNRTSLKLSIEPMLIFHDPGHRNTVIKLGSNYAEGLVAVESAWQQFFPSTPLNIIFLDERFEQLYTEDKRFGRVFGSFSVLAIIVAVLGLFGLSSFMAVQRTKEVGVRKVLGASVNQIILIFYKDFLTLILVAAALGTPVVYFVMNNWLENYAYRISFPWILIGLSVLTMGVFALLTVGYQVYKVAVVNPSKTLRYE